MTWKGSLALVGGLLLWIGLFVFCRVEGAFLPWFLFYFYTVIFAYELLAWLFALRNISVERAVSATRLSAGQSLAIRIRISRHGLWPTLWLGVSEELPAAWSVNAEDAHRVVQPLWNTQINLTYRIHALKRGLYRLGDTRLETGDVFGLQHRSRSYQGNMEIIVYPQVVPVRGWSGTHPDETSARQPTSHITEESSNVMGVRDYVPGDRLSRIHWKASARNGMLLSKEFELHVSSDLVFLADLSKSSHEGISASVFELEMIITASLMKFCFETHRRFGLLLHGSTLQKFDAGTGEALFLHCMEALAVAQPDSSIPFTESVLRTARDIQHGGTLVVVSPRMDKDVAVAIHTVSKWVGVQWFVPYTGETVEADAHGPLSMMQTAGARVHLVPSAQHLSQLNRGGERVAIRP